MIVITKTSDQRRQGGCTPSTCIILTSVFGTLCSPPRFLDILQIIWVGRYSTKPFLVYVIFLSTQVSPVSHITSTTLVRILAFLQPPLSIPDPVLVPVPVPIVYKNLGIERSPHTVNECLRVGRKNTYHDKSPTSTLSADPK